MDSSSANATSDIVTSNFTIGTEHTSNQISSGGRSEEDNFLLQRVVSEKPLVEHKEDDIASLKQERNLIISEAKSQIATHGRIGEDVQQKLNEFNAKVRKTHSHYASIRTGKADGICLCGNKDCNTNEVVDTPKITAKVSDNDIARLRERFMALKS